jgi:hypothetical protein
MNNLIDDSELPAGFHCPKCKTNQKLRLGEIKQRTPKDFSIHIFSFTCPKCQTQLKSDNRKGHWLKDTSGSNSIFILEKTDFA